MDEITAQAMLGRYRLLNRLGKGGMGEVWLAEDPLLRRRVAIKRILQHNLHDDEYLIRFEREARAIAALHHPHILPLHDYGQQRLPDGQVTTYIVMSYVGGGSVEEHLARYERQKILPPASEAFTYLSQAASAIDFAHERGVLHRDIKPANMLLREDNTLLLADFGLARLTGDDENLTHKSMVLGTPKYMAPEQAQGRATPASDIYSLAVIAYRCFTGQAPFNSDTPYGTVIQHIVAPPPSPRQFNPTLSPAFEQALLWGLAKDPAQRPPTASAFVNRLRQTLYSRDLQVAEEPTKLMLAPPATTSRRKFLLGAGAGMLALGAGAAALTLSPLGHALFSTSATPHVVHTRQTIRKPDPNAPAFQIQSLFTQPVSQLAWSPVTNTLAALSPDGQVMLWNIQDRQTGAPPPAARHTFSTGPDSAPSSFAWSPDGKMLALRDAGNVMQPNGNTVNTTLIYKSDLSGLVPGFAENSLVPQQTSKGLCWAPGSYILIAEDVASNASQFIVRAYNPARKTMQSLTTVGIGISPDNAIMAVSPRGLQLAVGAAIDNAGSETYGVLVGSLTVSGGQLHWQPLPLLQTQYSSVTAIAWSPDSRYLTASLDSSVAALNIWDTTHQYQALKPGLDLTTAGGPIRAMAWSPAVKNPLLAAGGTIGSICLWHIGASTTPVRQLTGLTNNITSLAWSPDGHWLAASYDDPSTSILLWKLGDSHG
jgi:serine/threonine protein kinase